MALSAIKLTRGQREAIYQAVRTHLVGLSDVFTLLEHQEDVPAAEKLARDFADDFRLLEDLGWHEEGSSGQAARSRKEAPSASRNLSMEPNDRLISPRFAGSDVVAVQARL